MKFRALVGLGLLLGSGTAAWAQQYVISTIAGGAPPTTPIAAVNASIGHTYGVATDATGNVYFTSDNCVFRLEQQNGVLTRVAGNSRAGYSGDGGPAISAQLRDPRGVAVDGAGNLFVVDSGNSRIRKVSSDGIITTVAGNGSPGYSGDGGPAINAQLLGTNGVAVDSAENLFITDNYRIRKISSSGTITTVAGGGLAYPGDGGAATSAQLLGPQGVAVDSDGNLFIAQTISHASPLGGSIHDFRIRKVSSDGIITTVAGNDTFGFSGDGGPAVNASLSAFGVAVDGAGNLFILDTYNSRIRKVSSDGIITTVAGNGSQDFSGDGGPATSAAIGAPQGVAVDSAGSLFISANNRIRKVSSSGIITTVAGNGSQDFSGDGGPAINAQLGTAFHENDTNDTFGVAMDGAGNLFIADTSNHRIRKVSSSGIITTVAGNGSQGFSGDGGPAINAQLSGPSGVAVDSAGNLFMTDFYNFRIRKVSSSGIITTVAGNGSAYPGAGQPGDFSGDGGPAINAPLNRPKGIAVDSAGNLLIADTYKSRIRKVSSDGIITTVAGNGTFGFSGDGGPAIDAQLGQPSGMAVDSAGNLFIVDSPRIRKVSSDGIITTVAGNGTFGFSGDGGPAINAQLYASSGVALDRAGNIFFADGHNYRIRKVSSDGIVTTVAGNGSAGYSGDGGPAINAQLTLPGGVAVDGAGNVYFADPDNHAIRRLQPEVSSPTYPFTVTDRGGTSLMTAGTPASTSVGYARIHPNSGSTTPSGLAIFGFRQNNILVSETGVPASLPLTSGRIYAEVAGAVDTGLAIANPNNSTATINFFFTDTAGNDLGSGSTTIAANRQLAKFLDQAPFNGPPSFQGTFTFTSDVPVGVIALRGLTNERSEFLMSTLPVIDTTAPPGSGTVVVPHFADGGGWVTQIFLVNPTGNPMTGNVQFTNPDGAAANVTIEGQTDSTFAYTVAGRSSQKLRTAGATSTTTSGSVRVVPNGGGSAPTPLVLFSYKPAMITVSEAGVPVTSGTAFRMYVESSGAGNIQSGIAVANTSSSPATVTFDLSTLSGATAGVAPVTLNMPGSGQAAKVLSDIFPSLGSSFRGVLRITTTASGLSVVGLRTRVNERGDFLITTTPPTVESGPASPREWLFPHLADGGGYTTQFILFSGTAGQSSSGTLGFFDQSGQSSTLTVN